MYLEQASKGFNPKIKEKDIRHAIKMNKRIEKYGLDLEDVSAHTMRIIEIFEEKKSEMESDKLNELKGGLDAS